MPQTALSKLSDKLSFRDFVLTPNLGDGVQCGWRLCLAGFETPLR